MVIIRFNEEIFANLHFCIFAFSAIHNSQFIIHNSPFARLLSRLGQMKANFRLG